MAKIFFELESTLQITVYYGLPSGCQLQLSLPNLQLVSDQISWKIRAEVKETIG